MRWESPWMLLALLLIPALLVWRRRRGDTRAAVLWVRSTPLGSRIMALLVRGVAILPWLALLLALLALAKPQQGVRLSETESKGVDIVLAIDISASMSAQDFSPVNRLYVARATAREFVRARPHDRVGVVGFSGTAFTLCPLTLDHEALLELLSGLDFGLSQEDGTAIGMGLATSVARLKDSQTKSKVIILLTDGMNNRGAVDPYSAAELAKAFGIKVYTVLVGKGGMVPVPVLDPVRGLEVQMQRMDVDPAILVEIAQRSGGRFYRATDAEALATIYSEIDHLERSPVRSVEYREYRDIGPWLLGAAAALLGFGLLSTASWAFRVP